MTAKIKMRKVIVADKKADITDICTEYTDPMICQFSMPVDL